MYSGRPSRNVAMVAGFAAFLVAPLVWGQNFGSAFTKKKIVLERKLPPTGHIDGTGIKVVVTAVGVQGDIAATLKSDLENILLRNDPKLRTEEVHPDTIITCTVTSYAQPVPVRTAQQTVSLDKKKPAAPQYMERVTGTLTAGFKAASRSGRSLAADNVKANYDREFNVSSNTGQSTGLTSSIFHSIGNAAGHVAKSGSNTEPDDTPPTAIELHDKLIQDAAMQIASHLVNTSEQVTVNLARGGTLDEPNKLLEGKLYSRALESLEVTAPFPSPEEDAYRLYNIGVANEALAYSSEDFNKARTYLQQAAINYGKAIDAKPTEKYFLEPQNRIDTALAHYKTLSDDAKSAHVETAVAMHSPSPSPAKSASASPAASGPSADPPGDALTNDQVIEMVSAHMDEGNIIDNIQHAADVNFDLSVQGQVYLSQHGVNGHVLTAMKTRARSTSTPAHRASR